MGTNDAREQLEVAKAECVRLEQENAELASVIETVRWTIKNAHGGVDPFDILDIVELADTDAALREVRAAAIREAANRLVHHLPPVEQLHGMADRIRQGEDER